MGKLRSKLYKAARVLGDAEAVAKGPRAVFKRKARKFSYKRFARRLNRFIK